MAAAPVGFALGAILVGLLIAPAALLGRYDLALPMRGWPPFAARIETLRQSTGAAWIGTTSYGLASQLADEPVLKAPVAQLAERDRWRDVSSGARPDLSAPGVVIDLSRRLSAASLGSCFAEVTPLGVLTRGDPGEPGKLYAVFRVSGPRRDVLALGC